MAWLGPAIGPNYFEVDDDVYHAFTTQNSSTKAAFERRGEKWLADLYLLARLQLNRIEIDQIYGGDYCTYTQRELFYSYRREGKDTGRMATLIWIED